MQTRTDSLAPSVNWLDPFGSWDAAARWSAITAGWMAKGWKQWLELVTVWPGAESLTGAKAAASAAKADLSGAKALASGVSGPKAVLPAQAGTQEARNARTLHAQALDSGLRGNDGKARGNDGKARAKREARPTARPASKRTPARRTARPQASARSTRSRG